MANSGRITRVEHGGMAQLSSFLLSAAASFGRLGPSLLGAHSDESYEDRGQKTETDPRTCPQF
jgi:hypothetical protein